MQQERPEEEGESRGFWAAYGLVTSILLTIGLSLAIAFVWWLMTPVHPLVKEARQYDDALRKIDFHEETRRCRPPFQIQDARFGSSESIENSRKLQHFSEELMRAALADYKAYHDRVLAYVSACQAAMPAKAWTPEAQKAALAAYREKMAAAKETWRRACPPPC